MLMRDQRAMIIRHIHYASESDPNRNTRETGIRRVTVRRSEEKCMEADVHQHGTSQAAREESWLPWKQGRLPLEEMILKKPLNMNPVGTSLNIATGPDAHSSVLRFEFNSLVSVTLTSLNPWQSTAQKWLKKKYRNQEECAFSQFVVWLHEWGLIPYHL